MANNDELFENRISSIEERDYYKVLGFSTKHLILILLVLVINYAIISIFHPSGAFSLLFTNPILAIIEFLPTIFIIALIRVKALSSFLYSTINDNLFKITPQFNTAYLTEYRKRINDHIINNPDYKIVVFKINSDDFYNKTDEEKRMIFSNFNRFLLSTDKILVFRAINKKLNLNDYFETIRGNIKNNVIEEFYYDNFVKSYSELSKNIPDYNYYLEIFFNRYMSDSQIETELNLILNTMVETLNIGGNYMPHLLRGNELTGYLKNIISGSEFSNIYDVPVITDY